MSRGGRGAAWFLGAGVLLWALVTGDLLRPHGGLLGSYSFVGADGREVEVLRRVDPRIDFPVPQRLDAAYVFHWDIQRFGFPGEKPPYAVRWRGLLDAPVGGRYGFAVDAQGEAALTIDGQEVEARPDSVTERVLASGPHAIALDYRVASGDARLVLSWQPPGRRLTPVPETALAPDQAALAARGARRAWGAALLLLGAAALALAALAARRAPQGAAGRLRDAVDAERRGLALAAILALATLLRFHDYALVPFHHETADEYQHAWEGWHLLHDRVPAAWSTFPDRYPAEQTRDFRWFGDRYVLVRPYFDHPPLFSLPVGIVCSLAGARSFLDCTLPVMRVVPILLSLVGLVLVERLARAYGAGERAALLAALVYATVPVIILGQRLVKGESLLSVLFVGAVLLVRDGSPRPRRDALRAGILGALSLWTKATGMAVVATVAVLLAARRRWRDAGVAVAVAAVGLALYLAYAAAYDFGIFMKVLEAQATSKWVALDSFHDLLGGKAVVKWFGSGTYLWLLLAAALAGLRRERWLLVPLVLYGSLIVLTADHRVVYGWYRVPMYPFLCVAAGVALQDLIDDPDLFRAFPFAITAVASGILYALPEPWQSARPIAVLFAILAVAPFVPRLVWDRPWARRTARAGAWTLVVAFLIANVATVRGLLEIYSAARGVP